MSFWRVVLSFWRVILSFWRVVLSFWRVILSFWRVVLSFWRVVSIKNKFKVDTGTGMLLAGGHGTGMSLFGFFMALCMVFMMLRDVICVIILK